MKEALCGVCPQNDNCSMKGSPMSEDEVMSGITNDLSASFQDCWFYRCPGGQLSALRVYRKYKHRAQSGIYIFGTEHKRMISHSESGITGRYVVVGDLEEENLHDGDIIIRDSSGSYKHLTNTKNTPRRI